jgi:hypothetical protein
VAQATQKRRDQVGQTRSKEVALPTASATRPRLLRDPDCERGPLPGQPDP